MHKLECSGLAHSHTHDSRDAFPVGAGNTQSNQTAAANTNKCATFAAVEPVPRVQQSLMNLDSTFGPSRRMHHFHRIKLSLVGTYLAAPWLIGTTQNSANLVMQKSNSGASIQPKRSSGLDITLKTPGTKESCLFRLFFSFTVMHNTRFIFAVAIHDCTDSNYCFIPSGCSK